MCRLCRGHGPLRDIVPGRAVREYDVFDPDAQKIRLGPSQRQHTRLTENTVRPCAAVGKHQAAYGKGRGAIRFAAFYLQTYGTDLPVRAVDQSDTGKNRTAACFDPAFAAMDQHRAVRL